MLETLATYRSLGTSLQWEWRKGWRYSHARYADDYDVRAYERGEYVPVWILRRDLGATAPLLSRAVRGLERMGLASGYTGDLSYHGDTFAMGKAVKFVRLTAEGEAWLKRKQTDSRNVGAYAAVAGVAS